VFDVHINMANASGKSAGVPDIFTSPACALPAPNSIATTQGAAIVNVVDIVVLMDSVPCGQLVHFDGISDATTNVNQGAYVPPLNYRFPAVCFVPIISVI
jgi:hypothetical protein